MGVCVCLCVFVVALQLGVYVESTHTGDCPIHTSHDSLLVEYGHPVNVNCSIQTKPSSLYTLGWEATVSANSTDDKTSVEWSVASLTDWEVNTVRCYLTRPEAGSGGPEQCDKYLDVTLYKRPDSVKIYSDSSVWSEGQQMELKCEIKSVGPVQNLTVQWTRVNKTSEITVSETPYGQYNVSGDEKKSVNVTATLNITASPAEDKVQYRCSALLKLDKLEQPVERNSSTINITVHYKPVITQPPSRTMTVKKGDTLTLNCSARGNPAPQFTWSSLLENLTHSSILNITIMSEDQRQFTCTAHNEEGSDSVTVEVNVEGDYSLIIIICAVIGMVFLLALLIMWYYVYYRHTHMGHYILKNLTFRRHNGSVAHGDPDQNQL